MLGLDAAVRQNRSLETLEHRPWPLPARGWTMGQTWEDLLFAHWRVPVEELRTHVPPDLEVEEFDGSGWVGLTPFRLTALRGRGMLPIPYASEFLELNVRTYVTAQEKPGIWFFSLDASSRLAVEVARRTYRLPYFHARMSATRRADWIAYECARIDEAGRVFSGRYRPAGAVSHAEPGTLEWFLTERYRLFAGDAVAEIHHDRWLLSPAEAEIELASIAPFALGGTPRCHCAFRQDALIWPPEPIAS